MITVDALEKLLVNLELCPVGYSADSIKFIRGLIAEINNSPVETVQLAACKSIKPGGA